MSDGYGNKFTVEITTSFDLTKEQMSRHLDSLFMDEEEMAIHSFEVTDVRK